MRGYAAAVAMAVVAASPAIDAQQQTTTDLKQVLFRMAGGGGGFRNPLGLRLLRGNQNEDSVLSVEFWATGTARIVQTADGQTVLDLTVQKSNTYNPYIRMPVPESVQKAAGR